MEASTRLSRENGEGEGSELMRFQYIYTYKNAIRGKFIFYFKTTTILSSGDNFGMQGCRILLAIDMRMFALILN